MHVTSPGSVLHLVKETEPYNKQCYTHLFCFRCFILMLLIKGNLLNTNLIIVINVRTESIIRSFDVENKIKTIRGHTN